MGYRSSVESIIYGEPERIELFIVKHKIIGIEGSAFEHFKDNISVQDYYENIWGENVDVVGKRKMKVIHLQGDGWKWYEDYDDVKAWDMLLQDAEEFGLMYEFVRVGENSDDIERQTSENEDGYLYPETYINCSLSIERS